MRHLALGDFRRVRVQRKAANGQKDVKSSASDLGSKRHVKGTQMIADSKL